MLLHIEKNLDNITQIAVFETDLSIINEDSSLSLIQKFIFRKTFERIQEEYPNQVELLYWLAQSPHGMTCKNMIAYI